MQTKMRIAMLDLTVLCLAAASTVGAADGVLMDPNTKDYPCWRGPYGSGAAPDCGKPLVASFSDAKQLWISEEDLPHAFEAPPNCFEGNFSSPVVAGGKVYLHYYVPTGWYSLTPAQQVKMRETAVQRTARGAEVTFEAEYSRGFPPEADDVILCLDAATGKTLWRTVYEKTAIAQQHGAGKSNGQGMMSVGYGRAYVLSAAGKVYCVDAQTGRRIWDKDTGAKYKARMDSIQARKKNAVSLHKRAPALLEGVFVCRDDDTVAFDAETGKELWRGPGIGALRDAGGYVRWVYKGKEYLIASGRCRDPRAGKLVWSVPSGAHTLGFTPPVGEDYVVYGNAKEELVHAYKVDDKGATLAWKLNKEEQLAGRWPGARGLKDLLSGREFHVGSLAAFSVLLQPYEIAVLRVG